MNIVQTPEVIGAHVSEVDLARVSDADFARIEQTFNQRGVICIRDQRLSEAQLIAFARRFGGIEPHFLKHYTHPDHPEILYISNVKKDGKDIGHADAGSVWHTDMSYVERPPRATLLYALEVPMDSESGVALGNTQFASAAAAYDSLSPETKQRLAGLRAIHQVAGRRAKTGTGQQDQALRRDQPAVVHPVVRTHPFTKRKCLYVSKGECEGIEGMAKDEALALIDQLAERTVEERFRYTHRWRVGDLLMWDNCAVQHLASFDYQWPQHRRLMHRVTVGGSVPF
ncbi:MAG: TauD/TfdA family dioxygenase [Betaproteobacteria bacterium]|nr:TauD/TfdA family dioxygenase [Betaproteobacteria bacterium]